MKSLKNVLQIIISVLLAIELILGIITIQYPLLDIASLLPLLLVALYGFFFYKKPHSNLLKYVMLIFALARIIESIGCIRNGLEVAYNQSVKILASVIIVYVAGRLDKIKQNIILLPIAFALILTAVLIAVISFASQYAPLYVISWFGEPILIIAIMLFYFGRYKEHKEVGLN